MKNPSFSGLVLLILALLLHPVPRCATAAGQGGKLSVAILGDSLSAGYGLPSGQAFPARLEEALRQAGYAARVLNGGVSGDTTAGGLARLEWTLAERPDLVILELGGNDALRGIDPKETRKNLDAMLERLGEAGIPVILAGMKAPRNLGQSYYTKFDRIYPELAAKHRVALYPFFLEGVAGRPELNQPDGIHPSSAGVEVIVEGMLPLVTEALERILEGKGAGNGKVDFVPAICQNPRLVVLSRGQTRRPLTAEDTEGTETGLEAVFPVFSSVPPSEPSARVAKKLF